MIQLNIKISLLNQHSLASRCRHKLINQHSSFFLEIDQFLVYDSCVLKKEQGFIFSSHDQQQTRVCERLLYSTLSLFQTFHFCHWQPPNLDRRTLG